MLALVAMTEQELAEEIERHINYVDKKGRSVRLPRCFVRSFLKRDDSLPRVNGFSTLPIVLPNGTLLTGGGLNRKFGIVFRVPDQLNAMLPRVEDCDDAAVEDALRFLCDRWLVDVAADFAGKCLILALCLTIIERMLLPERPCFFFTAGQRGTGKTTALHMVSQAVLGYEAVAAAWSPGPEERRKALFAYLETALPLLIWDNIKRGSTVSCPSIEKALTTEIYSDRVLGFSEIRRVPAYTVQAFTGNNIAPRGDLASRALVVRLATERPDPENRKFKHIDPVGWTLSHRGGILQALFVILRGSPRRRSGEHIMDGKTRFKVWWDMIGSALEHAADVCGEKLNFKDLFLASDETDEEKVGIAEVLNILEEQWPKGFKAADVAKVLRGLGDKNEPQTEQWRSDLLRGLEQASGKLLTTISATTVTWNLKGIVGAPVQVGGDVLMLCYKADHESGWFDVKVTRNRKPTGNPARGFRFG